MTPVLTLTVDTDQFATLQSTGVLVIDGPADCDHPPCACSKADDSPFRHCIVSCEWKDVTDAHRLLKVTEPCSDGRPVFAVVTPCRCPNPIHTDDRDGRDLCDECPEGCNGGEVTTLWTAEQVVPIRRASLGDYSAALEVWAEAPESFDPNLITFDLGDNRPRQMTGDSDDLIGKFALIDCKQVTS